MRFSLGCRTGRTLLHQCSYPEPRAAVQGTRHTVQDTEPLDRGADCVVPGVVSEAWGGCTVEESGATGSSPEDSLVGGCTEGELGAGEDGAIRAGGQGLDDPDGCPLGAPLDVETQGSGEPGDVGALGVVGGTTFTGGDGRVGGWVLWSLPPVSPRCRAIQSWRSGS